MDSEKIFKRDQRITGGDIVNIHNSFFVKNHDIPDNSIYVPNDSFAEVIKVQEDIQPLIQPLKGRGNPIKIDFIHLRVRLLQNNQEVEFLCLKEYLYAEKPEIDKDTLLALYISAKRRFRQLQNLETTNIEESDYEESVALANFLRSDPYLNAAQLRFGYALTVNRGQGQKFRTVIANMDTNQGKTNETYFRWVYTLFSIANHKLILSNIPSITPFDRAIWDASNSKIDSIYPCNFIEFDPNAEIGIENIIEFDIPEVALRNFYWYIKKKLDAQGIKITSYNHHNYQEIYSFEAENFTASCSIRFYYNGKYQISRVETIKSAPPDFAEKAKFGLLSNRCSQELASPARGLRNNLNLEIGEPVTVTVDETDEHRTVVLIEKRQSGMAFDQLEPIYGIVDRHHEGKAFIYLNPQKQFPLTYTDFPVIQNMKPGMSVEMICARHGDRINSYQVFAVPFRQTENISLVVGVLRLHQNGFGFVGDAFVSPELANQLKDGQEVHLIVAKKLDRRRNQLGWKAIALKSTS